MSPCSVDDFFPPYYESWNEHWPEIVSKYMCLSNSKDIPVKDNYDSIEYIDVNIALARCTNKSTCKNETEIKDFIDKNG